MPPNTGAQRHCQKRRTMLGLFLLFRLLSVEAGDQLLFLISLSLLQCRDHPPDGAVFLARGEHFEALRVRTPLQNVYIDQAAAPFFHFEPRRFIKVDRAGANERGAIIVDDIFLIRIDEAEPSRSEEHTSEL